MVSERKIMTVSLCDADASVLEELAREKQQSKAAVVRRALRLLVLVEERLDAGDKLVLQGSDEASELIIL